MFKRAIFVAALLLSPSVCEQAAARPHSIEDLLQTEGFGTALFDPEGRWLIFERLEPFAAMNRFDMLSNHNVLRSRLYRVDLEGPWRAAPLLPDAEPGVIAYGFSTDGSRLAVGRFTGDRWQLGIVTMASGAVRWLDLSPDYNPFYTTLQWQSPDRLVAIALPGGELPWWLRVSGYPAETLPQRWQATRAGTASAVTVIGSGRYQDDGPTAPDKALVAINALSGEVTRLATGRFESMIIAPDRRHLAIIERGVRAPVPQQRPVSQMDVPFRRVPLVYDLRARELWRPCADCDLLWQPRWSADGDRLAFIARQERQDWPEAGLVELSVGAKTVRHIDPPGIRPVISEFPDGSARAAFHWRGSDLLLLARSTTNTSRKADWYAVKANDARPLTSDLHDISPILSAVAGCNAAMAAADGIWCLDGSRPRQIWSSGIQISNGRAIGWKPVAGGISFIGNVIPGRAVKIGSDEQVESVEAAPRGRVLLMRRSTGRGIKSMSLVSDDRSETISLSNNRLADVEPAPARPLSYKLADGREVISWLFLPPGRRRHHAAPLVVIPYPGASYRSTAPVDQKPGAGRFYTSAQLLAGRGYAVLIPSLPARPFVKDEAPGFVDDTDRAVDAAIATGMVDPGRVALWGHSFGGYAVAMIAANSCRYASAIASAGVYDLAAVTGTFAASTRLAPEMNFGVASYFAWAETGQGGLGVPPWVDPARYISASPVYQAGRIRTPLLIIAADNDPSPLAGAEQLFAALARQEKDAELVTYWGEGHVVGSPANVRDAYERIFNWLARTMAKPARCPSAEPPPHGPSRSGPSAP